MGRVFLRASLLAVVAGCQSTPPEHSAPLPVARPAAARPVTQTREPPPLPAAPAPTAISRTPAEPVTAADDPLDLAADCLDHRDLAGAARYLERHVRQNPDQVVFRAQLGDLLSKLERLPEAQAEFEAAIAQAQVGPPIACKELPHYHTRLMEIARERGNEYAEHLHRGIGLLLVAERLTERGAEVADVERLLCKAAGALKEAQENRPDDARAAWYLYRVWSRLDQPEPAAKALRQAKAAAPFSNLTSAEARELALSSRPEIAWK